MVNISKVISTLSKLEGSSARVTLSGKQVLQIAEKNGASAEITEAISGLLRKHPKLRADVACKASEQGFTVGAMTLRDGKEVVGRGAASISGLGTEEAVMKMRLSAGKNGEIAQIRGWNNYAHTPRIQDYELSTSLRNGVVDTYAKAGEFGASRAHIDIPKAVEAAGLKEAMKKGNNFLEKFWGQFRDLLAGKEVDMQVSTLGKKAKFAKVDPKEFKLKELDLEKLKSAYKMPNGKMVDKGVFEKTIEEYFTASNNIIKDALKDGREKIANDKITELKNLAMQIKEETGYEIKCDWTKYLGDAFDKI